MNVDEAIYVHREDLIGLADREIHYEELIEAIHGDARGATEISILGGFYAVDALVNVCRKVPRDARRECTIRIAVGLEATALIPRTWTDMREVEKKLRSTGFRNVTVKVVMNSPVHFHTKLFRILRTTHPVWYVGSANPGSKRHELMLRLTGRHDALMAYMDAVFEEARSVSEPQPAVDIRTLRDFFLAGELCHKPPTPRLFTFDAFRFTPDNREQIGAVLAGEAGVEHARPRTEGFGFSLRSALGLDDLPVIEGEEAVAQRTQYRRSSVDTVLGLWMPRKYARELRLRIAEDEADRFRKLTEIADELNAGPGQERVRIAFGAHVTSLQGLLDRHRIEVQPVPNREALFERFLRSRTTTLSDEDARRRLARTLTLVDMPDIWEDAHAVREFETSFFEDLTYRASVTTGGTGRIIRSFVERLGFLGAHAPSDVRSDLEDSLDELGWRDRDWLP
ncbi:restriction endonuclease PLD domain-containing protein [Methylobacterium sp. 22177]|uniref:restriction endonuclease PLD domain-containing protein n=1 Tax=Methylobacterium sp. 22177 TaxID=3453885 RepID=UPI003F874C15